jgi:hypothetical protein
MAQYEFLSLGEPYAGHDRHEHQLTGPGCYRRSTHFFP